MGSGRCARHDPVRTCAHALVRRRDRVAQLRATRPAVLQGHVVLVNFWTLTCISWLRQEPYVRAWSQAYRNDGLVVLGVHTPEFSFEHDIDGVRQATTERAIDYPVAVDNDYAIWNAFTNNAWPALYFMDTDGRIRDRHFGEGRYEKSKRRVQKLLGLHRELVSVEGLGVEAEADWDHLRTSSRGPSEGARQVAGQHRQSHNVPPSKLAVPVRSRSPAPRFPQVNRPVRPSGEASLEPPDSPLNPVRTLLSLHWS
jgi:thiol-disulfide isomerase/thioredoxin